MNFVNLVITDFFNYKKLLYIPLFDTKKGMIHIALFYRQPDHAGHEVKNKKSRNGYK
jgi:hypothetical protein